MAALWRGSLIASCCFVPRLRCGRLALAQQLVAQEDHKLVEADEYLVLGVIGYALDNEALDQCAGRIRLLTLPAAQEV